MSKTELANAKGIVQAHVLQALKTFFRIKIYTGRQSWLGYVSRDKTRHGVCCNKGMIYSKTIQWHIHAGSWSLVNWWREGGTLPYIGCSWILIRTAVGLTASLGLDGDQCIRVIPRHPPFFVKEEALPACKETIVRNIRWSLRDRVMEQIWMYYKEKLTKNLANLNTFETSMSLRDRNTTSKWTLIPCLFTYVHTALRWLRGAKILQYTPVEKSRWLLWET